LRAEDDPLPSGLSPEQPSDDGAEKLVSGLAALFVVPRLGPPELALSAAGAVADDVGIPRRRRLSLSIPARVPWYSGIPRSAANPAITLRVYAHLFDSEAQATRMRDALEARFGGNPVVTTDGEIREKTGTDGGGNVLSMLPELSGQSPD
jgi:hypothetical protein